MAADFGGIDGRYAALITEHGIEMTDERREPDHAPAVSPLLVSPDQGRKLLNLVEVVDDLETFTEAKKEALGVVFDLVPDLRAMVEARRIRATILKWLKRFAIHLGGLLGALVAANEILSNYFKIRGIK